MQINRTGLMVFTAFCVLLWAAISQSAWMPVAEAVATVLILLGLAGILVPKINKQNDVVAKTH
jgi:ABC-type uncharacterized transport system permease subunit